MFTYIIYIYMYLLYAHVVYIHTVYRCFKSIQGWGVKTGMY